jgi:hypothetical protein
MVPVGRKKPSFTLLVFEVVREPAAATVEASSGSMQSNMGSMTQSASDEEEIGAENGGGLMQSMMASLQRPTDKEGLEKDEDEPQVKKQRTD